VKQLKIEQICADNKTELTPSHRHLTSGSPPSWGLGVGLTINRLKNLACYEMFQSTLDLDRFFGMT